jgi:hypothetical protein
MWIVPHYPSCKALQLLFLTLWLFLGLLVRYLRDLRELELVTEAGLARHGHIWRHTTWRLFQAAALAAPGVSTVAAMRQELDEMLAANLEPQEEVLCPVRFGYWDDGYVCPKKMGLHQQPHPGCCFGMFETRKGCSNGINCKCSHAWLEKDGIVVMLTHPNPARVEEVKKWLESAWKNWLANYQSGHVPTRENRCLQNPVLVR